MLAGDVVSHCDAPGMCEPHCVCMCVRCQSARARDRFGVLTRDELEHEAIVMFENLTALQTSGTSAKNLREEICELAQQVAHSVPLGTSLPEQRLIVDKFRAAVAKLPKSVHSARSAIADSTPKTPRKRSLNERVASSGKTGLPE